jgi:hypothetical protein
MRLRTLTPTAGRGRLVPGALVAAAIVAAATTMPAALGASASEGPPPGGHPSSEGSQPEPCALGQIHLRCPDLIMSAPADLRFDRSTRPGRVLLRARSSINNRGDGPLEVSGHRTGPDKMAVYQAIYDRRGRRHLFATAAKLVFKHVSGERYGIGNVGAASYWKLKHAAAFELWSIDAKRRAVRLVRRGPKVDYCLRDLVHSHPSRRSPRVAVYPACSQSPYIRHDILGTSVGWSDAYPNKYPEQWIDVTGLRGRFAYVIIADPEDRLRESNHKNDVSETYVALPSGRVLGHRVGVSSP